MTKRQRYEWICNEIDKRELREHLGRWTELHMKKNGDVLTVIRTGYGPMEYPHKDDHKIMRGKELLFEGSYYACCKYINDNY